MDLIKKHYEKVVLGVILLLATVAVASLPFFIASERATLNTQRDEILRRPVKPLTNLDMTLGESVSKTLSAPLGVDFGRPHNLLNPVQWQKGADGKLYKLEKGNEIGPEAGVVTKTTPLYLILTFNSVGPSSSGKPSGYSIGVEQQGEDSATGRRKKTVFAALDVKNDVFTLRGVKGAPENPDELVVELTDTGETVTFSKEKPYKRVDGYLADFRYPPENKNWSSQRVGAGKSGTTPIFMAGEPYIVVAITENEVVVSHKLTGKKYTIRKKAEASQS